MTLPFVTDEQVAQVMGIEPRWDTWGPATGALFYGHALTRIGEVLGEKAKTHVHLLAGCCSDGMGRAGNDLAQYRSNGLDDDALIMLAKAEQSKVKGKGKGKGKGKETRMPFRNQTQR
ncbi:hypothetical protein N9X94_03110 [Planktomarina temperata]|nr:hypothetical protein [Planktomarina temperata]